MGSSSNPLRVGLEVDVSQADKLAAASKEIGNAVADMGKKFMASGLSAQEAASALRNMGVSAAEAASAVGILTVAETEVAQASTVAATSMSGFERSAAIATGRVVGFEAGMGLAGGALGRVAAMLPGIGTLFAYALPVALIALGYEKWKQYEEAVRKARSAIAELSITTADEATAIEVENLKLEDQIRKLEGRPTQNALKVAIMEAEEEADKLGVKIGNDLEKLSTDLKAGPGGWASFLSAFQKANEESVGKSLEPVERQYQLAVLAKDQTAQRNALLQAQTILEKAVAEAHAQYTVYHDPETGKVSQSETRKEDTAALQDFQISLKAVNNLLEAQNAALQTGPLKEHVAALTQSKDNMELFIKSEQKLKEMDNQTIETLIRNINQEKQASEDMAKSGEKDYAAMERAIKSQSEAQMESTQRFIESIRTENLQLESRTASAQRAAEAAKVSPWGGISTAPEKAELTALDAQINNVSISIDELSRRKSLLADLPYVTPEQNEQIKSLQTEQDAEIERLKRLQDQYQKLSVEIAKQSPWQQLQNSMETAVNAGFNSFNNGFIRMLAGGQSFVRTLQQLWSSMAESFIRSVLQMAEKWIIEHILMAAVTKAMNALGLASHVATTAAKIAANKALAVSEAGLAGAAGVASFAAAPWPIDLGAPAFGAAMASAALGFALFEKGGIVGGMTGSAVPIIAHAGEAVLPERLTSRLNSAAGGGGNAGHTINVNYSPTIHALSSSGMSDVLREHGEMMTEYMMGQLRRRNAA